MGEIDLWRVDNLLARLVAACYPDGLCSMFCLVTAGTSCFSRLRAALIFRTRQLIARVIDHVFLRMVGHERDLGAPEVAGQNDRRDQQQAFEQPPDEHPSIREHPDWGFPR
jgi:hypothetical protein